MPPPRDSRLPGSDLLDSLFTRVQRVRSSAPGAAPESPADETPPETGAVRQPGEGSQVEEEWLREERTSLTEFTRRQFQAIRQQQTLLETQRQEVLRRQNELNETCLLRQQELNRQVKVLAAQAATLDTREKDLTESEKKLAVEEQRIARIRQDLQQYRREIADQEKELEANKAEAEQLLKAAEEAEQKRVVAEAALHGEQQAFQADREQFQQRARAVEMAEATLARERTEVGLLKGMLQKEVAERNLEALCQETFAQQGRLEAVTAEAKRLQAAAEQARKGLTHLEEALEACRRTWREEEAAWESRRRQMDFRYLALEKAEAALVRRTAELDRLDTQVQQELQKKEQELVRQRRELEEQREEAFGRCYGPGNVRRRQQTDPTPEEAPA